MFIRRIKVKMREIKIASMFNTIYWFKYYFFGLKDTDSKSARLLTTKIIFRFKI